ncbi:MAG: VOC family protein [Chitinophagaceae bacterium]|nr:MAG: VOC family protein [Chitinophagaceae bacterium]
MSGSPLFQPRISVLTLATHDLAEMRRFYTEILGWKPVAENKDIIFFQLNGFLLSLCDKKMLVELIGIRPTGDGFRGMSIGYNVQTKDEVFDIYEHLKNKVDIVTAPAQFPFGGWYFYFTDVEGNILEVACNDFITFDTNNNVTGHLPIDRL